MKVFKFGGASVRDAAGIKNLGKIVSKIDDRLVIVVSALGKTTNALEILLRNWIAGENVWKEHLDAIRLYHLNIVDGLFTDTDLEERPITSSFNDLKTYLSSAHPGNYDYEYDQIVSNGEIWSTMIVAAYLKKCGLNPHWTDIRGKLITDNRFRDAEVNWPESIPKIKEAFDFSDTMLYVTQGFIGGTADGQSTTLGREGSDYTAAILANILDAESVTVWKDVPGLLNADPKWLPDAQKLDEVSYREAVEMTFSGAKVIHPKTIKPLHNKNIPLLVRSFMFPEEKGTIIKSDNIAKHGLPVYIRKENQIMLSLIPRDFSFAMGDNLSRIFQIFLKHGIKVNIVEASAISIDVCIDNESKKVESLIGDLGYEFAVVYNENVEVLSIRHYIQEAVERITSGREILLEQRTRNTVRFVVRKV